MNGCSGKRKGRVERDSLRKVAAHYIKEHRKKAACELCHYAIQRNLAHAVKKAALCVHPNGKRHGHQRRLSKNCLTEANARLQRRLKALERATTFEELHDLVEAEIKSLRGIGDLTVYDVAHRIGAFRRLEPRIVYLHAGTLAGARALGISCGSRNLDMNQLPREFHVLRPYEAEDCLCIYKARIEAIVKRRGGARRKVAQRSPLNVAASQRP
jgi:hypothetical protein